eukprot:TRINITY_DN3393_c0_g1_i1.p1 TRINITY_DN3393_c0_g1~~TRINITY_DN3393_c0_g1_i1.p1  ORF type:complete len:381 (+),score=20.54 TRINITY_DN3393_c0_g1_i1:161-1303(+)
MLKYLKLRELDSGKRLWSPSIFNNLRCRIPTSFREVELSGLHGCDKIFALAWLDGSSFVFGSKANKLVHWDLEKNRKVDIPLPTVWPCSLEGQLPRQQESCGIHSIAINYSHSLLATGGQNPNDIAIFSLPAFEPVAILSKHQDWMFAAAWVTDSILVTGSRDKTVKLWNVKGDSFVNTQPLVERTDHLEKVRDLKYNAEIEKLATLSHDGTCKIWDPHLMQVDHTVECPETKELVCLAMEPPLVAIGSQNFITLMDLRCGHVLKKISSADSHWGVRSLSFRNNVLTCGGGQGKISFYDLASQKYIQLSDTCHGNDPLEQFSYCTGKGVLEHNDVYLDHFSGQRIQHAVYAHQYDYTGTRLLVGGGPLPYGLKGCYLAVW